LASSSDHRSDPELSGSSGPGAGKNQNRLETPVSRQRRSGKGWQLLITHTSDSTYGGHKLALFINGNFIFDKDKTIYLFAEYTNICQNFFWMQFVLCRSKLECLSLSVTLTQV
jgi:hypothetical protein